MYAYMYHKKSACALPMSAQIISSRTDEFLPLKISTGSRTSRTTLTATDFDKLEKAIHQIAEELLDLQHPFIQKTESQY